MLAESGYRQRRTTSELAVYDPENDTEFFYLRPRDIAIYVAAGTLDVGITGRDMLLETTRTDGEAAVAAEVMPLGFGRSSFRFASPADSPVDEVAKLEGKRIATAYPGLLQRFLDETGMKAAVVKLDGAVETACRLGVADAVCDVVETGATVRAAGLGIAGAVGAVVEAGARLGAAGLGITGDRVRAREAVLVGRAGAEEAPAVAQPRRRLQGVLVARRYVMLDYDCPDELLARATAI